MASLDLRSVCPFFPPPFPFAFAHRRALRDGCRNLEEWDKLAKWVINNKLISHNVRWLVQVPRLYDIYKAGGLINNFQDIIRSSSPLSVTSTFRLFSECRRLTASDGDGSQTSSNPSSKSPATRLPIPSCTSSFSELSGSIASTTSPSRREERSGSSLLQRTGTSRIRRLTITGVSPLPSPFLVVLNVRLIGGVFFVGSTTCGSTSRASTPGVKTEDSTPSSFDLSSSLFLRLFHSLFPLSTPSSLFPLYPFLSSFLILYRSCFAAAEKPATPTISLRPSSPRTLSRTVFFSERSPSCSTCSSYFPTFTSPSLDLSAFFPPARR
jgi:hypothetical protein